MATVALTNLLVSPAASDTAANVTAALTTITGGNTYTFSNVVGATTVLISVGTTGGTIQTNVGATIFGQSYAPFTAITLTASTLYVMGLFHSFLDVPGPAITVSLVTSGALTGSLIALQFLGVY